MVSRGRADLHTHTTASDGWPSPHQLVEQARVVGLDVIAVTDHDTIDGALRAADFASRRGRLEVIVGEEVSSR
ncbi:MAG TPA: PHP domain-containing protein, partial [Candidatus Dormibacteraeota bacterium]